MTYFNEDVHQRSPDAAFLDITDANACEKPSEVCVGILFLWIGRDVIGPCIRVDMLFEVMSRGAERSAVMGF